MIPERTLSCIKDFRHAVVQTLIDSNINGIGLNVSASRKLKAWPEEESYIIVNVNGAEFDDKGTHPRFYYGKANLLIDVYARNFLQDERNIESDSDSDLNDFLDDTMNSVVSVIEPCPFWKGPYSGLVSKCVLRSYNNNLSERTETSRGSARIVFEVSFTARVYKTGPTKDFLRAKNKLSADGGDPVEFTTNVRPLV